MSIQFYLTASGRSPIEEFLETLSSEMRLQIFDAFALLEAGKKLSMPLSRNLSGIRPGLHELRFHDRAGQVRIVYFIGRRTSVFFVHCFRKKTQDFPRRELETVLKRLKEL